MALINWYLTLNLYSLYAVACNADIGSSYIKVSRQTYTVEPSCLRWTNINTKIRIKISRMIFCMVFFQGVVFTLDLKQLVSFKNYKVDVRWKHSFDLKKVLCCDIVWLVIKSNFLKQTLIEAGAAADGSFYVFQQQQHCTIGWIFTQRNPCFSVIVALPGIQRTIWSTIFGSAAEWLFTI